MLYYLTIQQILGPFVEICKIKAFSIFTTGEVCGLFNFAWYGFELVFLGPVRSGSSSLNLELEPELEPAHLAVFRTRTEPEPIIPELEPNPNPWYLNSNRTRTLSMGSVRVQFKVHEQVRVQLRDPTDLACTKTIE